MISASKMIEDYYGIPDDFRVCKHQLTEARRYIDAALRSVELHKRHEVIPPELASKCPHLAEMLNEDLAHTVGID